MQFDNPIITQLTIYDNGSPAIQIGPGPDIEITGNGSLFIINPTTGQEIALQLTSGGTPEVLFKGRDSTGGQTFLMTFDDQSDNAFREYVSNGNWVITGTQSYWILNGVTTGEGVLFDPVKAELHALHNNTNQDWTNLTLTSGWTAKPNYYAPAYRYTPEGEIQLRGTMTGGTSVDNTAIATMPISPAKLAAWGGPGITAGGSALKRIFYNTDGKLYCYGVSGTTDIDLTGARFSYK